MSLKLRDLDASSIGRPVVYSSAYLPSEDGVITSFNDQFVFVRYRGDSASKATHPADLDWLLARKEPTE